MKKTDKNAPWLPVDYELSDTTALQALHRGEANEDQQKRALKWIIENACDINGMHFFPGEDGRRNTDFALGRRFAGQQIVKMLKLHVPTLRRNDELSKA